MGISIRQAARSLGVSHPALLKAAKVGSLQLEPDGTVDLAKARASEWWRNRQAKKGEPKPEPPPDKTLKEKIEEVREKARRLLNVDDLEFLTVDKIALEKLLLAERRESLRLDNEERKGNLIRADELQAALEAVISTTRSTFLLMAAKLSHKVAVLKDPAECQAVIEAEIKAALTTLSEFRFDGK